MWSKMMLNCWRFICQTPLSKALVAEGMRKLAGIDISITADSASLGQEEWRLQKHPEILFTSACHTYADRGSVTSQIHNHHPTLEGFTSAEDIFCGAAYH